MRTEDVAHFQLYLYPALTEHGCRLLPGRALSAPAGRHLRVGSNMEVRLTEEPADLAHRPSVDEMMCSAAKQWREGVVGVLITGMGRDGAEGMCDIRAAGGMPLAENEETCVVAGMPKAAFLRGGVSHYVPLPDILRAFHSFS